MPARKQGQIVLVDTPDPQGRNVKTRPAVIVSENAEIVLGATIWCIAITSTIPGKTPNDCVLLPYHANGHPRTGLKKRCGAMCSWLLEITEDQIQKEIGIVPSKQLEEILACLEKLD